jgi:hypothetical protein
VGNHLESAFLLYYDYTLRIFKPCTFLKSFTLFVSNIECVNMVVAAMTLSGVFKWCSRRRDAAIRASVESSWIIERVGRILSICSASCAVSVGELKSSSSVIVEIKSGVCGAKISASISGKICALLGGR